MNRDSVCLQTDPSDQDVLVQPFSERCGCRHMELWLTAVYGYRGPLLVSDDSTGGAVGLVCVFK